jgi:hypothetical protein
VAGEKVTLEPGTYSLRLVLDDGSRSNWVAIKVVESNIVQITGNTVAPQNNNQNQGTGTRYYCTEYGDFTTDLDEIYAGNELGSDPDGTSCNEAKNPDGSDAGFDFTTTLCCGDDGEDDTYSDPAEGGDACYKGQIISVCSQELEDGTFLPHIINEHGVLYSCGTEEGMPRGGIEEAAYCEIRCGKYCSAQYEEWRDSDGTQKTFKTWILDESQKGCCLEEQCWNGTTCVDSQSNDPASQPYDGYRCIDGTWQEAELKYTPDGDAAGYCPRSEQCLVSLQGNPDDNDNPDGNPQCITDGQYIGDDYCEVGSWSSRTKLIALQLLDLAQSNYVLFCGSYEDSLNYLEYVVADGKVARDYVAGKTNNFCILQQGNEIVFGASLSEDIDEGDYKFSEALGTSCSSVADDGNYHPCATSNVWYNKKLKSVIYSKAQLSLTGSVLDKFLEYLGNPFATLIAELEQRITEPYDDSFVKGIKKFRNLYINKQGSRYVLGALEGTYNSNLVIKYINFNMDICKATDAYSEQHADMVSGILCSKDGNNYYVLAQGGTFTTFNPSTIWADMTSKLRIS